MDDSLMPDWVKRRKAENALAVARSEARTERGKFAVLKIKADLPDFWRQLLLELTVNAEALRHLRARGRVHSLPDGPDAEKSCRVEVVQSGNIAGMTYIDLRLLPSQSKIWTRTLDGDSVTYTFCISPETDRLAVIADDELAPKTARELAESLVERMLDRVTEAA